MKKKFYLFTLLAMIILFSCQKLGDWPWNKHHDNTKQASDFSSEVPTKWLDIQTRALQVPPGLPNQTPSRYLAYCGVGLYESVLPGMPSYRTLSGQLNQMPSMPQAEKGKEYFWPASANAVLAYLSKNLYSATTDAIKASMDSLEKALGDGFQKQVDASTYERSVNFGREIGRLIYDWSKSDGTFNAFPPYIIPVGPGLWAPTPPNFPAPATPYAGTTRLIVAGSTNGVKLVPPAEYSTNPNSRYYDLVRNVYNQSLINTPEQVAIALYYRDVPGYPAGGHYLPLLSQVLTQARATLDVAAVAYAKTGMATLDAGTFCFKLKYVYNGERPIKYIREVLNHPNWNALFNTPGHPEFPSGHSALSGAAEEMMTDVFGENFAFTNNTYGYLGLLPRSYKSFADMSIEIGKSRFYGGIHFLETVERTRAATKQVARNILNTVRFKK